MKVRNIFIAKFIVSIFLVCGFSYINAQVINEELNYSLQKYPEETIYLQTDRSSYEPGEVIWLKVNVLLYEGANTKKPSKNLFVAIVDRNSLEIVRKVFRIENNQVSGNIEIPAKVTSGKYMLVAFTSSMSNYPLEMYFSREINIENEDDQTFYIDIRLKDLISQPNSQLTAYLKFRDKDSIAVSTPFSYKLINKNGTVTAGNGKTDKVGDALVTIALPAFDTQDNLTLIVDASYKRANAISCIVVPTPDNYLQVQFYPESGGLIYGADSKIVFRGFNAGERAIDFKGEILTNEGEIVSKIESTYNGIGDFHLAPEEGKRYHLRITHPSGISKTFDLPVPQISGAVVTCEGIKADTLILNFDQFNKQRQVYKLTALMNGEVYWTESTEITKHAQIKLACKDFPPGLIEFEAVDAFGKVAARRLIFINGVEGLHIEAANIKEEYALKEQVTLDIRVTDNNGNPVKADLSISAINRNLDPQPDNYNIYPYNLLKNEPFGSLQTPQFYFTNSDISKEQLDNLVIINASVKYNTISNLDIKGSESSLRKTDNKYDTIGIFNFTRNDAAFFSRYLNYDQNSPGKFYPIQGKNNKLKISKPVSDKTDNPEYDLSMSVADIVFTIKPYQISNGLIVFKSSGLNSINYQQGAIIVIDGILKGTNPSVLDDISAADIKEINISTNPIDIQRYTGFNSMGVIEIFMKNGNPSNNISKSDMLNKDLSKTETTFQSTDYAINKMRGKSKSDLRKTIYWNSDIRTDEKGEAIVSFFNGDIPSEIVITVEGCSSSGLIGSYSKSYLLK